MRNLFVCILIKLFTSPIPILQLSSRRTNQFPNVLSEPKVCTPSLVYNSLPQLNVWEG